MVKLSIWSLGIVSVTLFQLAACGETASKKTPPNPIVTPNYIPISAPVKNTSSESAPNALTGTANTATSSANITGSPFTAVPAVSNTAFAFLGVKDTTWESACYRFNIKSDFSKKYWAFSGDTATSLLIKYTDEACTKLAKKPDGTDNVIATWIIGSITTVPLSDNWSIVSGTCLKGCTGAYPAVAMRSSDTVLNEGSKVKTGDTYNTAEGQYVSFAKVRKPLDLEALAASLNAAVPASPGVPVAPATPAPSDPTTPTPVLPTTPPPVPAPETPSTGLDLISSLAGQTWTTCYISKNTENGVKVDRGFKRTLTFSKGADAALDNYVSGLAIYTKTDCTGDVVTTKLPLTSTNFLVTAGPLEGWILVESRACPPGVCSIGKSLFRLPKADAGLAEAGENKTTGIFYTATPRVYTLTP
ncbi:MAG: hypothetical protein H7249_19470 [Chitinophagaceae bacterium]|nr:hypothetical protein [Oligoflexus sp.]